MKHFGFLFAVLLICTFTVTNAQEKPDRTKPPEVGPPPALKLSSIQHLKLSNGVPVILMEKHEVPLVQIELLVKGGSAMDPAGKKGLASLATAMMEEGAGTRNALELADAIDFLGASVNAFSGNHTSGVMLHTPLSKLDSALALFGDIALRPTFPKEELERIRKERLTSLIQWHDRPSAIASYTFNKILYGLDHPYGNPAIGDEKSLRAITTDDMMEFHSKYFRPDDATIIVVGDISPGLILPKLDAIFDHWKKGNALSVSFPGVKQATERRIYFVDKPGAAQSEIRIGRIGVSRTTDDYFPLIVMNTILGGSFSSRLNQNLREKHGYTYGAGSAFDFRLLPGPFYATAAVQTDATDKALTEFMNELNGILQPIPEEEVERAKNYVALGYPQNFESVAQIAGELSDLAVFNLPDDYFNSYTKNILAVTKADVERVAKKYIDPNAVDIIIVGDKSVVGQKVAALKIAPITSLTIDEVLGPAPVVEDK